MTISKWVPLQRATHFKELDEELIKAHMDELSLTREQVVERVAQEGRAYWINDIYQVQVVPSPTGKMVQLNIRRRDGKPIFRDWRHFQQIKNELVGPECEGVELYPAESRLTDTTNKYHIWCVTDPAYRFPFGFDSRDVRDDDKATAPGLKQRRF